MSRRNSVSRKDSFSYKENSSDSESEDGISKLRRKEKRVRSDGSNGGGARQSHKKTREDEKSEEEKDVNVLLDDATAAGSQDGQRSQFGVMPVPQISDRDDPMANPKDKFDVDVKFLKNHFDASKIGTNKMKSMENLIVSWAIMVSKLKGDLKLF